MPPRPHKRSREAAAGSLSRVAPLVTRWVERLLAGHDPPLTLSHFLALEAIARGEPGGAELARSAAVSPAAVSQLLATMEDTGLLDRARTAGDRRRQALTLTAGGARVLASARLLLRERIGALVGDLPPPEVDALGRALASLEAVLSGTAPPRRPHRPPPPPPPPPRHEGPSDRRAH